MPSREQSLRGDDLVLARTEVKSLGNDQLLIFVHGFKVRSNQVADVNHAHGNSEKAKSDTDQGGCSPFGCQTPQTHWQTDQTIDDAPVGDERCDDAPGSQYQRSDHAAIG